MFGIVLLVGLAGLVIGIIASVKGELTSLHIPNRKVGTVVTIVSLFFVLTSGAFVGENGEGSDEKEDREVAAEEVTAEVSDKKLEKKDKKERDLRDADWIEATEEIVFADHEIQITGETNLEDQAVFLYEVTHADNVVEGTMEVKDGVFSEIIDIADFNDGEIAVRVTLELDDQPEDIRKRFNMEQVSEGFAHSHDETFMKYVPIELSGSGDMATEEFSLAEGFAVFEMNHEGGSNFVAALKDETGETVKLLVNEIGSYGGKTFFSVPSSESYVLDITADGSWNATVSQTIPEEMESDPVTIEGTGDDVVFIDVAAGKKRFELSHTGDRNFVIHLNGSHLLVNEIGEYEGSSIESFADDGIHAFSILADGQWKLTIE